MDSAKQRCYVAYDVSKATLMVAAPKGMPQGSLDNTQGAVDKQLQALIEHANRVNETLWLVCEATGGYQRSRSWSPQGSCLSGSVPSCSDGVRR